MAPQKGLRELQQREAVPGTFSGIRCHRLREKMCSVVQSYNQSNGQNTYIYHEYTPTLQNRKNKFFHEIQYL